MTPIRSKWSGLGRVPHHDPRSDAYPLSVSRVDRVRGAIARALRISQPRSWRQYDRYDQGATPHCTAFGSATFLAADPIHQTMPFLRRMGADGCQFIHAWFNDIQAEDRRQGRIYDDGATVVAAMEVGKARGYWDRYEWATALGAMRTFVHDTAPLCVGFNWYESQWDRDAHGIARITKTSPIAGGHFFVLNGYDPKRALYRSPSTWGDGDYWLPEEDVERLLGEDGEAVFPHELRIPV